MRLVVTVLALFISINSFAAKEYFASKKLQCHFTVTGEQNIDKFYEREFVDNSLAKVSVNIANKWGIYSSVFYSDVNDTYWFTQVRVDNLQEDWYIQTIEFDGPERSFVEYQRDNNQVKLDCWLK